MHISVTFKGISQTTQHLQFCLRARVIGACHILLTARTLCNRRVIIHKRCPALRSSVTRNKAYAGSLEMLQQQFHPRAEGTPPMPSGQGRQPLVQKVSLCPRACTSISSFGRNWPVCAQEKASCAHCSVHMVSCLLSWGALAWPNIGKFYTPELGG